MKSSKDIFCVYASIWCDFLMSSQVNAKKENYIKDPLFACDGQHDKLMMEKKFVEEENNNIIDTDLSFCLCLSSCSYRIVVASRRARVWTTQDSARIVVQGLRILLVLRKLKPKHYCTSGLEKVRSWHCQWYILLGLCNAYDCNVR